MPLTSDDLLRRLAHVYDELIETALDRPELFARVLNERVAELIPSHGIVMILDPNDDAKGASSMEDIAHVSVGAAANADSVPVRLEEMERGQDLVGRLMQQSLADLNASMRARFPDLTALHTHWHVAGRWEGMALCIVRVDRPDEIHGPFTTQDRELLDVVGHHMMTCIRVYVELTRVRRSSFDFFAERCRTVAAAHGLTTSELKVLRLIVDGMTNSGISAELGISLATVKTHVSHILQKTGCRNRTDVIGQHFSSRNVTGS